MSSVSTKTSTKTLVALVAFSLVAALGVAGFMSINKKKIQPNAAYLPHQAGYIQGYLQGYMPGFIPAGYNPGYSPNR